MHHSSKPIYLDYNATTPHDPEVIEAMRLFLEAEFGNPSSGHAYGSAPREAVATARADVAALIGTEPENIVFTSGGTESNNYAILGTARAMRSQGNHIITSTVEHPAVAETCRALEAEGFEVTRVAVDQYGLVTPADVERSIRPETILVTVMHANNEIGTVQPIDEISRITRQHGVLLHTDAAQSLGKIPVNVDRLGVDMLTVAGHKLYAPKGIGALYLRDKVKPMQIMYGGGQERGLRPGTENVLEIVGLGTACRVAARDLDLNADTMKRTRDLLHRRLEESCDLRLNGHPEKRLPNTLNVSFHGTTSDDLIVAVSDTVAMSAGSACHSESVKLSPVIEAIGVPLKWGQGTIRLSTGKFTTDEEVERAASRIAAAWLAAVQPA